VGAKLQWGRSVNAAETGFFSFPSNQWGNASMGPQR